MPLRIPGNSRGFTTRTAPTKLYGQPTESTHPHLIRLGELTPGIPAGEYAQRRKALLDRLPDDSVAICVASNVKYASKNIFYRYRQNSSMMYLTGLQEPDSALIIEKPAGMPYGRTTLFTRPRAPTEELWDGPRTGQNPEMFRVDEALEIEKFSPLLTRILATNRYSGIYMDIPDHLVPKRRSIHNSLRSQSLSTLDQALNGIAWTKVKSLNGHLQVLRRVKSPAELELMRRAASISANAHARTMRFVQDGISEGAVAAHFEYLCALRGSERPAYVPVVASAYRATTIHYTANDQIMRDGDLLLMDAGAELHGYASDITRTWPVSGHFSDAQAELYQAVLNTLKQLIPMAKESSRQTLQSLHRQSTDILVEELKQTSLGLDPKNIDGLYPHYVGHPLGLDLHESGNDQRHQLLVRGMVITLEPGVYVRHDDTRYPAQYRGLGIRIEDEVVVHQDHSEVLSAAAPKEISDVEGACQGVLGLSAFWEPTIHART